MQDVQTLLGKLAKLASKSGGWRAQRHQSPQMKSLYYRKQKIKARIQTIDTPPNYLLTDWRVFEFEEDGRWITRFIGIASHIRTPVLSPPIQRFDPNTACGQDADGEVWLLFPGEHADQAHTGYEPSCDVTALFVEAVSISDWRQD